MSVVHERQSRQLCAVHAANNLLQLHHSLDDTNHQCMYHCGPFLVQRSCNFVTKTEMDRIADDLTLMESNLIQEGAFGNKDDGNDSTDGWGSPVECRSSSRSQQIGLSITEKLISNHRTMYLGCYSFESLELCLKRRGVALEWYRVPDDPSDAAVVLEMNARPDQLVCGFIINLPNESSNVWGALRYIPLVGRLMHVGRHWFSVTRLRRQIGSEQGASAPSETKEGWLVLDSDRQDIVGLCDVELIEYLASIHARGGQTFRATIHVDR